MSEENIELVRRAFDAYNRGDLDAVLDAYAPDAVVDWSNSRGLEARVFRGHGEIRRFTEGFLETFEEVRTEFMTRSRSRKASCSLENVAYLRGRDGIEIQARSAWLITVRDGKQTSLTLYQTKQEALEAAEARE